MPLTPIKKMTKQPQSNTSIWKMNVSDVFLRRGRRSVPTKDLATFCRKLTYLLMAGLTMKAALPILQGESLGGALPAALLQIHTRVMQGGSFSDALKTSGVFPGFMVSYVTIGEKTGQLALVCEKLADYYEQQTKTRQELLGALMYPAAVLCMMVGVIILAMVTVLPGYARIFETSDITLPAITTLLLNISAFVSRNALWLLGGIGAAAAGTVVFVKSRKGRRLRSETALKIPLLRQGINLHLVQALTLLLTSGVRLSEAVQLCIGLMGNVRVKEDLTGVSQKLSKGQGFSASLEAIGYIDPLLQDLARVGEETGALTQAMQRCLDYFTVDYKHRIRRANKLIEPIITLVMGMLIAFVMLAVVLPTFQLAAVM